MANSRNIKHNASSVSSKKILTQLLRYQPLKIYKSQIETKPELISLISQNPDENIGKRVFVFLGNPYHQKHLDTKSDYQETLNLLCYGSKESPQESLEIIKEQEEILNRLC